MGLRIEDQIAAIGLHFPARRFDERRLRAVGLLRNTEALVGTLLPRFSGPACEAPSVSTLNPTPMLCNSAKGAPTSDKLKKIQLIRHKAAERSRLPKMSFPGSIGESFALHSFRNRARGCFKLELSKPVRTCNIMHGGMYCGLEFYLLE